MMQALFEERLRQKNADQQTSDQLNTDTLEDQLTQLGTALPLNSNLRSHAKSYDLGCAGKAVGLNFSPSQCSR